MTTRLLAATIAFASLMSTAYGQTSVTVDGLRCEYLVDPLGIDVVQPRLSWVLDSGERGQKQTAYQIMVASSADGVQTGRDTVWDSGRVASEESVFVPYAGPALRSGVQYFWKVRVWDAGNHASAWSKAATWSMGLLTAADWKGRFIGSERAPGAAEGPLPFPWLRKSFTLASRPVHAMAYVNALGYYELYVNGRKVGDSVLAPAVSDYSKRNLYVTHDVSSYLVPGKNTIAVWLGRGWYVRGHPGVVHDGPLVRMQMDATLTDGSTVDVATDQSWKVKDSPITPLGKGTAFGDYGGEHYDASLDVANWAANDFDDTSWKQASVFTPPQVLTAAQMVEPNRMMHAIAPVKLDRAEDGGFVVDMGRDYTGWFEVALPASIPAGQTIKIEYADQLSNRRGFASFNQRDEYVTRAGAGQVISSRFNYHAFRFAKITGLEQAPELSAIHGHQIRTSYAAASEFESSNELLNRIYSTTTWTYEQLTMGGYVVDCPHRERLGYGGDAGTSFETGMFNFDSGGLYNRWTANWRDAQAADGDIPYTAPSYPNQGGGGPMWSGFAITLPWQMYLQYGDKRILETSYPVMQKLLAFFDSKSVDGILEPYVSYGISMPQWNYLGDWVTPRRGPEGSGPRDEVATHFINNCYRLYVVQITAKTAALLGRAAEAAAYQKKASEIRDVLNQRYFHADTNTYATGEQPYLALPLLLDMVPADRRDAVRKNLENAILVTKQGHLDSGMHGTYFLLKELMQEGRNDLIFTMTNQRTYPGWGYMLEQGATTMWEGWEGGGSRIHDTLISIGSWFIQGLGGIRYDEATPGFKHFSVEPAPVGDLTSVHTSYDSIRGKIVSDWRKDGSTLKVNVTVPVGTTATVRIPASAESAVTEGGRPVSGATGVRFRAMENGRAVFEVESGSYEFASRM